MKTIENRPWFKFYPKGIPQTVEADIEKYSSVLDVFEEACGRFPSHSAYSCMGKTITYRELNQKAEAFAAFLQTELHLKKGDRIALQMPNILQYPVALFGSIKAGLVIVNTNPLYTEREMKHQFADSGCKAIVILANFAKHLQNIVKETAIEHVIVTELGDQLSLPKKFLVNAVVKYVKKMVPTFHIKDSISFNSALSQGKTMAFKRVSMKLDDVGFLQYTGGTTGVSKGAMLSHRNVIANMEMIRHWVSPILKQGEEVAICALPLYHIFAFTVNALGLGKLGAHNILITNPRDISGFVKELKKTPFTVVTGVNTLFNGLMNHKEFNTINFKTLKVSVAGGMALQRVVAERWKKITGTSIIEAYGLTETSPGLTANPFDGTDRVGTIGLPLPSTDIILLDDNEKEVPLGERGELCAKGPQVMSGYWQKPSETALVMTKSGWFKTGDIAVADADGFFKIVDRKKDMILVSGFNVYPNEIEDVIATHPGVLEVAAVGVPDEKSGEVVKVFIVKRDPNLTIEDVIKHARESLTSYKIPKLVEFRTELPKTNVGKILRRALRDQPANAQ
jgi:long-chain acyl-CoA synthetase